MNRSTTILLALAALGLAGCTAPTESGEESDTAGSDATPEYIVVNGATYECDDTINADGICDGYELNEGEAGEGGYQTVTPNEDGTLTLGGYAFHCTDTDWVDVDIVDRTDTRGACERYGRDE